MIFLVKQINPRFFSVPFPHPPLREKKIWEEYFDDTRKGAMGEELC